MMAFKTFARAFALLLFPAAFALPAVAQNTYLKAGGAYNFSIGSSIQVSEANGTVNPNRSATLTHKQVKVNFGEGVSFQGAIGHYFTPNFGLEVAVVRLPGKTYTIESRYYHTVFGVSESYNQTYKAKILMVQPSVIFRMEPKTFTPYGKMGISLAGLSAYENHKHTLWTQSIETDGKYTGGTGFGFQGAAGLDIVANKQITFFLEGNFSCLTWAPERWERLSYKENGQSAPQQVPGNEWEIAYADVYQADYDANGNRIFPQFGLKKVMKEYLPVNTAGLGLGVKVTF